NNRQKQQIFKKLQKDRFNFQNNQQAASNSNKTKQILIDEQIDTELIQIQQIASKVFYINQIDVLQQFGIYLLFAFKQKLGRFYNPRFKIHLQQRRTSRVTHNSLYEYKKNLQQVIIYYMILIYVCFYIFICCCKFNLQILFFFIILFKIIIQIYSYFTKSN
ncbi:transmembrane protein, putative, partial (macronuclear) [Tetrahymena thermophila SB210]